MNLSLLLSTSGAIQLHIAAILIACLMSFVILPLRKGTRLHKTAGWIWSVSMIFAALVSFWIHQLDTPYWFSWIHILSLVVLFNVPYAIWSIRNGNVRAHKASMLGVMIGGLGIAGLFTLQRGRLMYDVFFAGSM